MTLFNARSSKKKRSDSRSGSPSSSSDNGSKLVKEIAQEATANISELFRQRLNDAYASMERDIAREKKLLDREREQLQQEIDLFERMKQNMEVITKIHTSNNQIVKLDVGGVHYSTTVDTLRAVPNSLLDCMFSGQFKVEPDENGRYFIDRNGKLFAFILDFLRNGSIELPTDSQKKKQVLAEAEYFGLKLTTANGLESLSDLPDFTITMSSLYASSINTVEALRDTNLLMGCATNNSADEFIRVTFPFPCLFTGVKIAPLVSGGWDAYCLGINLEYSNDNVNYHFVMQLDAPLPVIVEKQFAAPITAQYWRLRKAQWFAVGYLDFVGGMSM